jgi:hypothetical protein
MTQGSSFDPILVTIVLATLAIGLPIVFVLAIRFLWERQLSLGRSKDFDKLIWQLHRIASAMEHQMNVSFPAVQPGTEEARDLAYLQQVPQPGGVPKAAPQTARVAPSSAPVTVSVPVAQPAQHAFAPLAAVQQPIQQPVAPLVAVQPPVQQAVAPSVAVQQPVPQQPAAQAQPPAAQEPTAQPAADQPAEPEPAFNPIVPHDPAAGPPRHAGVNSMFGF